MSALVAEQAASNAANDCASGVVTLNLFVPALLARTFNGLRIGGDSCRWQSER
jgi:hypothetical protein